MRPKKTILCVDPNETTLSIRKFMLETRGYRVLTATCLSEAVTVFSATEPLEVNLLVAELGSPDHTGNAVLTHFKGLDADLPTMLTSRFMEAGTVTHCADLFCGREASPIVFVDRVRVLTTRKRGPRKKPVAGVRFAEFEDIRGLA